MTGTAVATITSVKDSKAVHTVHFNPASLKISISNRLQDDEAAAQGTTKGKGNEPSRQNTRVTTSKLETELVYDTTETGADVRDTTRTLKSLAVAEAPTAPGSAPPAPPQVEFRWGRFKFVGVIESLSETLDFWAAEGVPLRSTVQITLQGLNAFADENTQAAPITVALNTITPGGTGTTGAAAAAGDTGGGRAVATANGIEDMRMAAGGAVAVSAGVQLQAAAAFSAGASASAGFGASAGAGAGFGASAGASAGLGFGIGASASAGASAGFGAGAGFGASASAGFGASASAGFGASASGGFGSGASAGFGTGSAVGFSAKASAGATASSGAFASLGVSKTSVGSVRLDPARLLPTATVQVGSATQFDVTGRAVSTSSSGLSANVTARAGIRFG